MAETYKGQRLSAVIVAEDTRGTFKQPQASDRDYPLEVTNLTPNPNTVEGLRDSNGKFSRGQTFPGQTTIGFDARTYLMQAVDATSATGKIEIAPLLEIGGFRQSTWDDGGTEKLSLIMDGEADCTTGSMTGVFLGCGEATQGYGWDVRGIRSAIEIVADTSGGIIFVTASCEGAEEDNSYTKTAVTKSNAIDVDAQGKEMFLGAVSFDGVSTPIENFTISMNPENTPFGDPAAEGGVGYIETDDYDKMITMTAKAGTATVEWWNNLKNSDVVDTWSYIGDYVNIIITNLSIRNHSEDTAGTVALTQELSFEKIEIQFK